MTMITNDCKVYFKDSETPFHLDLNWIKDDHFTLSKLFELVETKENPTMMSERGEIDVEKFLEYIGGTLDEARSKHPKLNNRFEYREEHNDPTAYGLQKVEEFYTRLANGEKVEKIELAVIEHF